MTQRADVAARDTGSWFVAAVDVATMWTSPSSPRDLDAPALSDQPDQETWTKALDADGRLGLHGRTETQLLRGEPAQVLETVGDWVCVVAPWQPSPKDARGYPGWVRKAHLARVSPSHPPRLGPPVPPGHTSLLDAAREFLGVLYLWGGISPYGFDCSGLVHYCYRQTGVVVPRDAAAQCEVATPVRTGRERVGDLYFFASSARVSHVGIVTGPGRMLHAPESSGRGAIEEADLTAEQLDDLVAVGRLGDG